MWLTFASACLASVVVLYAPGYFAGRAVRLGSFCSVVIAPAFSVVLLVAVGVLLHLLGISCPAWALLLVALLVSFLAYGVSCFVSRKGDDGVIHAGSGAHRVEWKLVGLYVGASLLVFCVVYVHAMADPYGFCRLDDSVAHYSLVRSFLDTGFYSTLHAGSYASLGDAGGFYPAAWHVAVAVVASLVGDSVSLATNAMTLVVCAVVLPVGLDYFMTQLFPGKESASVVCSGAFVAVAFCGFPWGFLVWGQLLPNLLSFSLIPAAMGLVVALPRLSSGKVAYIVSFAVCLIAAALSQPNGAFTLGIWAVVFGASWILSLAGKGMLRKKSIALAFGLVGIACVAWALLFFAPPLRAVTSYTWPAFLSPAKAILSGLTFMSFERLGVQPFLTVLVTLGCIRLCKDARCRWLVVSFALAWVIWFIGATTDGFVKQLLSGFWYTDYCRVGAMASLFAIPIAAVGLAWLFVLAKAATNKVSGASFDAKRVGIVSAAAVLALMLVVQFFPAHAKISDSDIRAGLMAIHKQIKTRYSWQRIYTAEEQQFLEKATETVSGNSLIVNFPNDGSCYAYGIDGANILFRRCSPSAFPGDGGAAAVLRTKLCDVSSSEEVQGAVKKLGAEYVLLLDAGKGEGSTTNKTRYKKEDWLGIESISDETKGFTLVLAEGDMRLYRIDAAFDE